MNNYDYQREKYSEYLFNCRMQGDIWNEENIPYTFEQWIELGMPENGGISYF